MAQQQEYPHGYFHGFCVESIDRIWGSTRTNPCAVYRINGKDLSDYTYKEFSGYRNAEAIIYAAGYDGYQIRVIATRNSDNHAVLINIKSDDLNDYEILDFSWGGVNVLDGSSLLAPTCFGDVPGASEPIIFCGCGSGRIVSYNTFTGTRGRYAALGDDYVHALTETKDYILACLPREKDAENNNVGVIVVLNKLDLSIKTAFGGTALYKMSDDACCSGNPFFARYAYFVTETDPLKLIIFDNDNPCELPKLFQWTALSCGLGVFCDEAQGHIWIAVATEWKSSEPSKFVKILEYTNNLTDDIIEHLNYPTPQCNELGFVEDPSKDITTSGHAIYITHWFDKAKITQTEIGVSGCEYTQYACDGKIADDNVPSSAVEGSEVTGAVTIDNLCLDGNAYTRYRVKFTVDGNVGYSGEFILKSTRISQLPYPYEEVVSVKFKMPNHDVTLIAEVEHCNDLSVWKACEHADHIKTYSIALALYEGPYGVIPDGYPKLIKDSTGLECTDTCEDTNPCFLDKGDDLSFKAKIQNVGNATGKFQVFVVNKETEEEIGYAPFGKRVKIDSGKISDELDIFMLVGKGSMIDHNYPLRFEARRYDEHSQPTIIDGTKSIKVCFKHVVDHYSIHLNDLPAEVHTGDKITFSGTLSHDAGGVVKDKLIEIMEKDIDPDDFIASGTTVSDGTFAIQWTVKKVGGWLEGKTAEFYARLFENKKVTSNIVRVSIVGPSITKALVYGGIAVAVFAGGSIAESFAGPKGKMIGTPVKLGAIIPAGLCGYQTYLIAKDKVPEWLKD